MSYFGAGCLWTAIYFMIMGKLVSEVVLDAYNKDKRLQVIEYGTFVTIFATLMLAGTVALWPLSIAVTVHDMFNRSK